MGSRSAGLCQAPAGVGLPLLGDFPFHPVLNPRVSLENKLFRGSVLQIYASHNVYNHIRIMWPHFCRVSVIVVMISFPTLSISSLSGFIFQQKPLFFFFHFPYHIFTLFQVWRMTCFVTSFISYSHVVFHYRYPELAAGDSTWQRVTDGHRCVTSPSGSDSHTWGRAGKSG